MTGFVLLTMTLIAVFAFVLMIHTIFGILADLTEE